ncbi:MAG: citramalate synthase, partial [Chitinivibrionales bacterium]
MSTSKATPGVAIYDTTLRDGNQAVGIGLSLTDKVNIAEKLNEMGFHYIEGGWPNPTNQIDTEFYRIVAKKNLTSKIAAFGSTRRPNGKCEDDIFMKSLISTEAPVATIYGKSWDLHVTKVINTTLEENLAMIGESVAHLKKHMDEVVYDAEHFFDGYRHNREYAMKTLFAAQQGGADVLVLCDTNGGTMPSDFLQIYRDVAKQMSTPLGVHMHNDTGCADANSFLGVAEGATHVQGTVNGLGERCGNANLCTIVPGLQIKRGLQLVSQEQLKMMTQMSIYISEIANISHNIRHPYVGESAFSHKAGAHADGVRKVRRSFEHISPDLVGNYRRFVVSDQAGSSIILEKLKDIRPDLDKKDPQVKKLLMAIKEKESNGYHFEAADGSFKLIAREMLGMFEEPFKIIGFRVIEEKRENGEMYSEATIKVDENTVRVHTASEGEGPVNALDNALRKA